MDWNTFGILLMVIIYFKLDDFLRLQGKFIRIHFGPTGKLASADIDICE